MAFVVQQADLDVIQQEKRTVIIKAELLNNNFQTVESLEGEVIQDDYSIDADSDIRRTYKVTLAVQNSTFQIGRDTKIWFDKYIRLSVGLYYIRNRDYRWYSLGLFVFNTADYFYDAVTKTLTLSCCDITANFTGLRNGQVSSRDLLIPGTETDEDGVIIEEHKIRDAVVKTITQLGNVKKYRIEDGGKDIPHDLNFSAGTTVYDIIKTLTDLYTGWEMFFDEDMFICQPIPLYESEPIVLDSTTLSPLVVNENTSISFGSVYNVTEVWGKDDGGSICAVVKLVSKYPDQEKIDFDSANEPTNNIFYNVSPDSPFCSDYPDVGEIRQVLSSGDFENITDNELAMERAKYENWRTTDLLDTVSLTMVDIPWLDVNQKVEYYSNNLGKTQVYLVKSKSGSTTNGTMSVSLVKFQPIYPWL
jgi:hypothetical protein